MLVTRVMFGCLAVADLEQMLDKAFPDDRRFVHTGVRRPGRRTGALAGARVPTTCRGSFLLDEGGRPVPDSLSYSPLVDFARHVRAQLAENPDRQRAVAAALRTIDQREERMRTAWDDVADGSDDRDPAQLVIRLLLAVSVQVDVFRYVTEWVPTGQQPTGQLPAFFRDDLLAAAAAPTSPLVNAYLAGRPQGRPARIRNVTEPLLFTDLVGRQSAGVGSDRIGRLPGLAVALATAALSIGAVAAPASFPVVLTGFLGTGLAYGAVSALVPAATAERVDAASFPTDYGVVFTGWGCAGLLAPLADSSPFICVGARRTTGSPNADAARPRPSELRGIGGLVIAGSTDSL